MRDAGEMHHMAHTFEQGSPIDGVLSNPAAPRLDAAHRGDRSWIARGAARTCQPCFGQRRHHEFADEARGAGDENGLFTSAPLASA